MGQHTETLVYTSPANAGEHLLSIADTTIEPAYAGIETIEGLVHLINDGAPGDEDFVHRVSGIAFPSSPGVGRVHRVTMGMGIVGTGNIDEDLYLVIPQLLDGTRSVGLIAAADIVWSADIGAVEIPTSIGGRANHVRANSVTLTPTGALEAMVGIEALEASISPAIVSVYDVGPCIGLLRHIGKPADGAATSGVGMHQRWR